MVAAAAPLVGAVGRVNTKREPFPWVVLDPDLLAVGLDERLGDRQAETGPAPRVEANEAVEDHLALFRGDAGTLVADRQRDPVAPYLARHGDHALRWGMTVGIVEEVSEDLADEDRVDVDVGQGLAELGGDVAVAERGVK